MYIDDIKKLLDIYRELDNVYCRMLWLSYGCWYLLKKKDFFVILKIVIGNLKILEFFLKNLILILKMWKKWEKKEK